MPLYYPPPESTSFVCVCNATYCDTFPPPAPPTEGSFLVVTSDIYDARFRASEGSFETIGSAGGLRAADAQFVLTAEEKQTILGFGGAVTDSASYNILTLSEDLQDQLLRSYYAPSGLEYNLNRINIGGCDFSSRGYTYADTEGDVGLETFALQEEDLLQKIPILQRIAAMSEQEVLVVGAAWTAPGWMKSNGDIIGYGQLLEEMYQPWAEYHVKFLDAYAAHNISVWGISPQNEPLDGNIPGFTFNCMGWTPFSQRKFIAENLGPLLEERGYGDLKLMILDDQRIELPYWAEVVFNDSAAFQYTDGIAVHWYVDYFSPEVLTRTHDMFPDKFILGTEACEGDGPLEESVIPGSWKRLETYATDIIEDLEHWVVGWLDWNIALDQQGGPNWCDNFVDSPIIVDPSADEFYKNPMYYAMGHFSKFLRRGAVHRALASNGTAGLKATAAINPDQSIAIVILNDQDQTLEAAIEVPDRGTLRLEVGARSLNSILFQ